MAKVSGILSVDEDGALCMKMQLSADNPEVYDVPLEEILEDFIGKRVSMEIFPLTPRYEVKKD